MLDTTEAYGLTLMFPKRDSVIGASLRDYGEFARPEVDLIGDCLQSHPGAGVFMDVGGNIGSIALPVAARHRNWLVMTVEAHRGLAGVLAANALNNQLYNVEVINAAAGAEPGLVQFPANRLSGEGNFGTLGVHMNGGRTEAVRMCTLDEIAPDGVRFVKIDVEGFEAEVLKGAAGLLAARQAAWLVEAHRKKEAESRAVMQVFLDAGYSLYWFFAPFVTPAAPKASPPRPVVQGDTNVVAFPPGMSPPWEMTPVGAGGWPADLKDYPYLRRYGFG